MFMVPDDLWKEMDLGKKNFFFFFWGDAVNFIDGIQESRAP